MYENIRVPPWGWISTKLGNNDPYMSLFNNCSNGYGLMHI